MVTGVYEIIIANEVPILRTLIGTNIYTKHIHFENTENLEPSLWTFEAGEITWCYGRWVSGWLALKMFLAGGGFYEWLVILSPGYNIKMLADVWWSVWLWSHLKACACSDCSQCPSDHLTRETSTHQRWSCSVLTQPRESEVVIGKLSLKLVLGQCNANLKPFSW